MRNQRDNRTAENASVVSKIAPKTTNTTPSSKTCDQTAPASGRTNCGSKTEQNSSALGLSRLPSTPFDNAARSGGRVFDVMLLLLLRPNAGERKIWIATYARYNAPAIRTPS